jgi:hypothetical protein
MGEIVVWDMDVNSIAVTTAHARFQASAAV